MKGYIYRHWVINDKGEEKSYIGKTTQKPHRRWRSGKGDVSKCLRGKNETVGGYHWMYYEDYLSKAS